MCKINVAKIKMSYNMLQYFLENVTFFTFTPTLDVAIFTNENLCKTAYKS